MSSAARGARSARRRRREGLDRRRGSPGARPTAIATRGPGGLAPKPAPSRSSERRGGEPGRKRSSSASAECRAPTSTPRARARRSARHVRPNSSQSGAGRRTGACAGRAPGRTGRDHAAAPPGDRARRWSNVRVTPWPARSDLGSSVRRRARFRAAARRPSAFHGRLRPAPVERWWHDVDRPPPWSRRRWAPAFGGYLISSGTPAMSLRFQRSGATRMPGRRLSRGRRRRGPGRGR